MRVALLLLIAACSSSEAARGPKCQQVDDGFGPRGEVPIKVEVVATGLEVPWGLAFLPDHSLLVTERAGSVKLIANGQARTIAHVPIAKHGEGGLLGIALAPDAKTFYVYVTAPGPTNRVERWRLADDHASATFDRVIFDGIASARYHDGGRIAFGPDGMLYVGTGDATQPPLAQDRASPNGKVLRLTPDGAIPNDNPIRGNPAYVIGLRNVEAFDWRDDGALAIADHGPSGELGRTGNDRVLLAHAGDNAGWPAAYGCHTKAGYLSPSLAWTKAAPPGGAAFYKGPIADWRGDFLIGTLKSEHLHRVRFDREGNVVLHDVYLTNHGRLRTVVMGPDGGLYVMTSNCDGRGTCPKDKDVILKITE